MKQYKDRKKGKDKKQEKIELLLLFILENFRKGGVFLWAIFQQNWRKMRKK